MKPCSFGTLLCALNTLERVHAHTCTHTHSDREVSGIKLIPQIILSLLPHATSSFAEKYSASKVKKKIFLFRYSATSVLKHHFFHLSVFHVQVNYLCWDRQISLGANTSVILYPAKSAGLWMILPRHSSLPLEYPKAKASRNSPPHSQKQHWRHKCARFLSCENS